jgi:hypothetical protein
MPFDWMDPSVPKGQAARERKSTTAALEREMADRAALLRRLGYSLAEAKLRVRGNLLWDFEIQGRPAIAARVDDIVSRVYGRSTKRR